MSLLHNSPRTFVAALLCLTLLLAGGVWLFADDLSSTDEASMEVDVHDQVAALHDEGYTGSDVRVGVVDVTDVNADALGEQLVDRRTFGERAAGQWAQPDGHGTAAAALAGSVAPDAELYFASIADERSFEAALEWLLEEEVDVVVTPVSFYGKPDDGSSFVERAASSAAEAGAVVVTPAGNTGQGHWQGRYLSDGGGYQSFGGTTHNRLHGEGEELVLWVSWTDPDAEFTLELHRENRTEPVATSRAYDGDAYPNARIVTTVDPGADLSFSLRGEAATGTAVTVTSPTHEFAVGDRQGSVVAPGSARDVLTVGAYDLETGIVEAFSAAGPTGDNRTGVDVVAPNRFEMGDRGEFVGTSAAAPYTAGIAALLLEANPALAPSEVTALVRGAADDRPPYDDGDRVGGGLLDPVATLEAATGEQIEDDR